MEMEAHSIKLHSHSLDFVLGSQCIFVPSNAKGLAARIFDELFKPAPSGTYFLYMRHEPFLATMGVENSVRCRSAALRFYSTHKASSVGEYSPMTVELGLDKDWREDGSGIPGHQKGWMNDLYYRSFADSPDNDPERFWREFAADGTGVRLTIEVETSVRHADFRYVTYEGSPAVAALAEIRQAFQHAGFNLRVEGFPRMPAFGQLAAHSWQREVRLITKRYGPTDTDFPWRVHKCSQYSCNYIDCSLTLPDSDRFRLRLVDVTPGPNTDGTTRHQIADLFDQYLHANAAATPSVTSRTSPNSDEQ